MSRISLSGGDTFYAETGRGRPMVVLHGGLGLDHTYLRPAFDRFADTHRVIYMDFLGNGQSDRSIAYDAIQDNGIWVRQLSELIDKLDLHDPIIVGHSYGGYVALEHAITHSSRCPMILVTTAPSLRHVERVIENVRTRGTREQIHAVTEELGTPQPNDEAWAALWRTLLPLYFHRPLPELVNSAAAKIHYSARGFNAAHLQVVPKYDVSRQLDQIDARTLIVAGDDDWILPVDLCSIPLAKGIKGADLAVIPQCGHFPFMERGNLFHAIVADWLNGLATKDTVAASESAGRT